MCRGLLRVSIVGDPSSLLARVCALALQDRPFLVLSRARLGQVLPDAALAPVAVAVPQLVGAHVLIARRCKTIQGFEAMRASPLILAITGFGLGVKHLNTCTCISACGLRASAYGVRAHMYARTHTGHGNNFGSLVARQGELSAVFSASRDNGHLAFGLFLGDPRRCPSCARLRLHPHTRASPKNTGQRWRHHLCDHILAGYDLTRARALHSLCPPRPGEQGV